MGRQKPARRSSTLHQDRRGRMAIVSSFNGKLKDECLRQEIFYSLEEAQTVIWDLAEYLQPRSTAFVLGLPAARACHLPGSGLPVAHGRHGLPPCSGPSSKLVRGRPGADPVCGPRPMQVLGRLELTPFVVHGLCKVSGCWS